MLKRNVSASSDLCRFTSAKLHLHYNAFLVSPLQEKSKGLTTQAIPAEDHGRRTQDEMAMTIFQWI